MNATTLSFVGVDVAKNVFQAYEVMPGSGEIRNIALRRAKFLAYFVNHAPCVIGMEACGGAQHWARELIKLGHEARLMPARAVKAFVTGNKSDAIDAKAIWMAVRHEGIKFVAIKSECRQGILAIHRMRAQLMKTRIMQSNELRGLLTEHGEVCARGEKALSENIAPMLERVRERLPAVVVDSLRELWARIGVADGEITVLEKRLKLLLKEDKNAQRIFEIPGVGLLSATAASAMIGDDPHAFKSGRQFSAWIGLVPAHTGTGGKTRMLGLSGRGDPYLRTLLMHGARSVLLHTKNPSPWLQAMLRRRPVNVVVTAIANKMARTIWALLAHGRDYEPNHRGVGPLAPRG